MIEDEAPFYLVLEQGVRYAKMEGLMNSFRTENIILVSPGMKSRSGNYERYQLRVRVGIIRFNHGTAPPMNITNNILVFVRVCRSFSGHP